MKKRIFALTLTVLALVISACDSTTPPAMSTTTEAQTDEPKVCAIPSAEYSGEDLDAFIDEWASVQPSDGPPIVIPTLNSSDFRFFAVEVREYSYSYFYHPSDPSIMRFPDTPFFDSESGIRVSVSRTEGSFEAVMAQNELTPTDGMAYDPEHNDWFVDIDGYSVSVRFPDTVVFEDADELSGYFTFEVYSASDDTAPSPQ